MLKTTAVFLPLFFNSVFARRGGGGGGGSGGGGAGLDTVFYQPTECYAGFLNPYPAFSNETVGGNNETNINKTTGYSYYYIEENYGLRKGEWTVIKLTLPGGCSARNRPKGGRAMAEMPF